MTAERPSLWSRFKARVAGWFGAPAPFDPARIHSLLFVVDSVNARPGDGGALWVEGLRTER